MRFFIQREQIERQATQNLIDAGQIAQDEARDFLLTLGKLDSKDLLAVLLESHQLKEDVGRSSTKSYPIDYLRMGSN